MSKNMNEKPKMITRSTLKSQYGLTDKLITLLGEPDKLAPNPHYRSAAPMALYLQERVEAWIETHQEVIAAADTKKRSAAKAITTKRNATRQKVITLLQRLDMRPLPTQAVLVHRVSDFILARYGEWPSYPTQKAICSFIRHAYTNYETILHELSGMVGNGDYFYSIKLYLCCRIVKRYALDIHPRAAAGETHFDNQQSTDDLLALLETELGLNAELPPPEQST